MNTNTLSAREKFGCSIAGFTFAVVMMSATPLDAFECPLPHPRGGTKTIRETPAQISEYRRMLGNGDDGNAVSEIIFDLKRKYPEAGSGEITNFLVTAYCPTVKAQGYSDSKVTQKVKEFSSLVAERLLDMK
jgi:hypothetical protein